MSPQKLKRTSENVEALQQTCVEAGRKLADALDIRINTEIHRVMRHVSEHIFDFGSLRCGATDENGKLHKLTKRAYRATNQKLAQIYSQLLNTRVKIDLEESNGGRTVDVCSQQLLLTRDILVKQNGLSQRKRAPASFLEISAEDEGSLHELEEQLKDNAVSQSPLVNLLHAKSDSTTKSATFLERLARLQESPDKTESSILELTHCSTHNAIWRRRQYVRFHAVLSWASNVQVAQTVYAGEVHGEKLRRHAIEYCRKGHIHKGVIHNLLQRTDGTDVYGLIPRLAETDPEAGNVKIVRKFGHKRYRFELDSSQKVVIDCVPVADFRRQVMVVKDLYDFSRRHGVKMRLNELADTKEERNISRFFEVYSHKYTSFSEALC